MFRGVGPQDHLLARHACRCGWIVGVPMPLFGLQPAPPATPPLVLGTLGTLEMHGRRRSVPRAMLQLSVGFGRGIGK